jgi:hypothetical protein
LREHRFEILKPHRFFYWSGHGEPERFTESKGRFKNPAIESADDEHGRTIILRRQKAEQLDPVHSRHAEVKRDHVRVSAEKLFAKFSVVGGYDGLKPAAAGGIREERGERRLVIDQQQARLRQFALLSPPSGVRSKRAQGQADETPF